MWRETCLFLVTGLLTAPSPVNATAEKLNEKLQKTIKLSGQNMSRCLHRTVLCTCLLWEAYSCITLLSGEKLIINVTFSSYTTNFWVYPNSFKKVSYIPRTPVKVRNISRMSDFDPTTVICKCMNRRRQQHDIKWTARIPQLVHYLHGIWQVIKSTHDVMELKARDIYSSNLSRKCKMEKNCPWEKRLQIRSIRQRLTPSIKRGMRYI